MEKYFPFHRPSIVHGVLVHSGSASTDESIEAVYTIYQCWEVIKIMNRPLVVIMVFSNPSNFISPRIIIIALAGLPFT